MFKKQGWHILSLAGLLAIVYLIADDDFLFGGLSGISTRTWFWIAISVPIAHQIVVPLVWRGELHHKWMTRTFGDKGFLIYKVVFTVLFAGRPISLILVGFSNYGSLGLQPVVAYVLAAIFFVPAAYGMYSVIHYFGIDRAYGIDLKVVVVWILFQGQEKFHAAVFPDR